MNALILGGAASGKSAFAERLTRALATRLRARPVYLATLDPGAGGDTRERILRHRAARAGTGFATLEWTDALTLPPVPPRAVALVEDGGNLVANYLFPPRKPPATSEPAAAASALLAVLRRLDARCAGLVVVSNEISLGGDIPASVRRYADTLATLNRLLAAESPAVHALVAGIPLTLK